MKLKTKNDHASLVKCRQLFFSWPILHNLPQFDWKHTAFSAGWRSSWLCVKSSKNFERSNIWLGWTSMISKKWSSRLIVLQLQHMHQCHCLHKCNCTIMTTLTEDWILSNNSKVQKPKCNAPLFANVDKTPKKINHNGQDLPTPMQNKENHSHIKTKQKTASWCCYKDGCRIIPLSKW